MGEAPGIIPRPAPRTKPKPLLKKSQAKSWITPEYMQRDGSSAPWQTEDESGDLHPIAYYIHGESVDLNEMLRSDNASDRRVAAIDSVLDKRGTSQDLTVYRGVPQSYGSNLVAGEEIVEPGYMSTSLDETVTDDFKGDDGYTLTLNLPAGARALYVPAMFLDEEDGGDSLEEQELLLGRGLKLRVASVDHVNRRATINVIDDGPPPKPKPKPKVKGVKKRANEVQPGDRVRYRSPYGDTFEGVIPAESQRYGPDDQAWYLVLDDGAEVPVPFSETVEVLPT